MRPSKLAAAVFLSFLAVTSAATSSAATEAEFECTQTRIAIRTEGGPVTFEVEIADTPALREKGLMFRRDLPPRTGMLFVYDEPRTVAFWMRNTLIPLDMVFLDRSGVIQHIHPEARPLDETPIPGALPDDVSPKRQFILEIGGGEASRLGLEVGQAMASPAIDQVQAAWPCPT